jgi:uncharacterized protein (DUF433 family)
VNDMGERPLDVFRTGKSYNVAQAARLAGTTPVTVHRWLVGYEIPGHQMAPVFGGPRAPLGEAPWTVSFLELAEIVVVARFRRGGPGHTPVPLERLRLAHTYARKRFRLPYPFASMELRESGGHVLHDFDVSRPNGAALTLDIGGQWVLPGMVRTELQHFEYRDGFASRWFPAGHEVPIVVDPHIAAGRPTIAGTAVTVDTIRRRFAARQSIQFIAEDFQIDPDVVERALQLVTDAA